MDPILQYDRLGVLRDDLKEYEVLIRPKDLKILSKERREDLLQQKVHLIPYKRTSESCEDQKNYLGLEINMDPNFERHSYIMSSSLKQSESSTNQKDELMNEEQNDVSPCDDKTSPGLGNNESGQEEDYQEIGEI